MGKVKLGGLMSKKKIFITTQYMELGGVERSLIGLLDAIDYSQYEVDVFIHRHVGELMPYINTKANLLPEIKAYTTLTRPIFSIIKEGYFGIALGRLLAKRKARKFIGDKSNSAIYQYIADNTTRFLPKITETEYDLAISFIHPHNIVRDKVRARKKVAWIHTDYSTMQVDIEAELSAWGSFDHIVSISESSKVAFCKSFPSLESKIVVIENMLSPQFVREQAALESISLEGEIKLLTVARFSFAKGVDNAVRICARLVDMGLPIKWYAIGYGDEATIRSTINEYNMENHFTILGKKVNPYPYMKACDIYVQPSRFEGKAVTVREAQMLGKPVVITAFPTSASQLSNAKDGIIVPMDIEGAAAALAEFIVNKNLQIEFSKNCLNADYGNFADINKLYDLI